MKKMAVFGLLFISFYQCTSDIPQKEILMVTSKMEEAWNTGNKSAIATHYSDDTYVISPRGIEAQGREGIHDYWTNFRGKPVEWKLKNYLITKDLNEIFQLERYRASSDKMPLWTDFEIPLPDQPVFQYGQSFLVREREIQLDTSIVEFLLVWKQTDGAWQIYLDSYR